MIKAVVFILLISSLIGITGCSNNQCNEAEIEETRLLSNSANLVDRLDKKRKELTKSIEYHCSNLDESDIVLYNSDIWCDNWRSTGVTPPVGYANIGYEIKDLTKKIEDLEDDFENSQNRWALTVTTYKDCFEPSKVIDATEILSK
jgi:malate synthase